jgi:type II secretory ATPase GspE/PulE/Tfp pilus assembly ATPase PilB-like protein
MRSHVTAPAGSGKTTTLSVSITILNEPSRKIVTVEEPVEYQVAGIHRTQNFDWTWPYDGSAIVPASRFRCIMAGETRDPGPASTAAVKPQP